MTFEKAFVLKKLQELSEYMDEARHFFESPDEEILKDWGKLHIAERLLQLIVDTMIDVNQHFIRELELKGSEDFQGTFHVLGETGVLPSGFAQRLAPVVGLRNRIVHRYDTLDKKLFIRMFRRDYPDFDKYVKLISKYVSNME